MWCKNCKQDVPSIASSGETDHRCARCGAAFAEGGSSGSAKKGQQPASAATGPATLPLPDLKLDDWSLDDDLQRVRRLIGSSRQSPSPATVAAAAPQMSRSEPARQQERGKRPSKAADRRPRRGSFFAWLCLSTGLMAFVCGGVLLGWSVYHARPDLWNLGMPITLAGQFGLLLGLVWQLDTLWQHNRETVQKLDEVTEQLHDLNHTTTLLGSSHSSAAQSFYVHMAEGAHPHLLLADLKSQLDLLAVQMSRRE